MPSSLEYDQTGHHASSGPGGAYVECLDKKKGCSMALRPDFCPFCGQRLGVKE